MTTQDYLTLDRIEQTLTTVDQITVDDGRWMLELILRLVALPPSSPVAGITVNDFVCAVGEMTNEDALQRVKELVRAEDARIVAKCSPLNGCTQCNPDYPPAPSAPAAADDRKDP